MSFSFSKITIKKFDHERQIEDQLCGLEVQFAEEINDHDGRFQYAKEQASKLRNFFCHADLIDLFYSLRCHLAAICEMENQKVEFSEDDPDVVAPKIYATGITMTGAGETEGIVIVGFKVLSGGQKLNLVTPNIGFENYEHGSELIDLISQIEREAEAAYNGKRKIVQGSLFEDEPESGTDDEPRDQDDAVQAFKKMKSDLKKKGVELTVTTNA